MIHIRELNKKFGKHHVLQNINLQFELGQGVALIGPNGSGKTTLIKALLGMVIPDKGEMLFNGSSIKNQSLYRQNIGYMPQISRFPDNMKVGQLFNMIRDVREDIKADVYDWELYDSFEIEQMKTKRLNILSGGMKQKVSAALAFLFNPKVLVLDEPTAGLDPVSNEILKEKLRKSITNGKLVLITSHILNDLDEITTHVAYLMDGKTQFFKSLEQLKMETSEDRLNKIIAHILNGEEAVHA
ncbi:ATP-binding cassette domain-containing protein [Marivirga sp. S37H4]|uniref:ATP-binding cassette domain-containing protein n=1 Tax=Marivirga aurantiaca TaxID=2802615 RepID=A0A934WY00_9BACT|nr:ATP-binding cassette domain-containing protein [Marivirga aurantiaca]MBK6264952.1 ATP-binding cassette domain-containing protein [Marivirga aurantiaca]